jgi:hypothetical protein
MLSQQVVEELHKLGGQFSDNSAADELAHCCDDGHMQMCLVCILAEVNRQLSDKQFRFSVMLDRTIERGIYTGSELIRNLPRDS